MNASGEEELIARHFAPLARHPGALGLLDDAAVLTLEPGFDLVVTTDALVAGVHFFPDDPPDAVARKALRVNLSDLAAKGAEPVGFLLALALGEGWTEDWLALFARGLAEDAERYGAPLLGGDTVKTRGALTVCVTALGRAPPGRAPRRTGAKPGDLLYVTGTIGDGALGLRLRLDPALRERMQAQDAAFLLERYLSPQPRLEATGALRAFASAAMDVSDGLVGDLGKMLRASGVGAVVEAWRTPLSEPARRLVAFDGALFETALTGGDDYEILCTVPRDSAQAFEAALDGAGLPVTRLGSIVAGRDATWLGPDGAPLAFAHAAYSHF